MFVSNSKYYLKETLSATAGTGGTFKISTDLETNANLETGTDTVSVVFKSGATIERMIVTATG